MGPEGLEPSTASAPGLYPQIIHEYICVNVDGILPS